jgi:hypothetical protein
MAAGVSKIAAMSATRKAMTTSENFPDEIGSDQTNTVASEPNIIVTREFDTVSTSSRGCFDLGLFK